MRGEASIHEYAVRPIRRLCTVMHEPFNATFDTVDVHIHVEGDVFPEKIEKI